MVNQSRNTYEDMRIVKFKVHIYEWNIKVVVVSGKKDIPAMKKAFIKFGIPRKPLKDTVYHVKKGNWGGDHFYTRTQRKSMVLIYNCNSIKKTATSLFHELGHVADRILETMNINDPEATAYLYGYIAKRVVPEIFKLK